MLPGSCLAHSTFHADPRAMRRRLLSFSLACTHLSFQQLPGQTLLETCHYHFFLAASAPLRTEAAPAAAVKACHRARPGLALVNHARAYRGVGKGVQRFAQRLRTSWTSVYASRHKHQSSDPLSLSYAQLVDRSRLGTLGVVVALANGTRPASSIVVSIPVSTVPTTRVLLGFGFDCSLQCWRYGAAVHASVASQHTHASGAMALPPRGM